MVDFIMTKLSNVSLNKREQKEEWQNAVNAAENNERAVYTPKEKAPKLSPKKRYSSMWKLASPPKDKPQWMEDLKDYQASKGPQR